jgi:ribosomal protein L24E
MASTPDGNGYWLVARDGGIFTFGTAHFYGSTGGKVLNQPILGMMTGSDGKGYRLVARDGGIFTFGSARYRGSMGGTRLTRPIVGID